MKNGRYSTRRPFKFFLFILVLIVNMEAQTRGQKNASVFNVSGTVLQTMSYCGGAAPSHEMVEEAARPSPYQNKVFYVRKGKTNDLKQPILLKFTADSTGNFNFKLPAGIYSIIQEEQVKALSLKRYENQPYLQFDQSCLKTWWKTPYFVLDIKDKAITELNFVFHHRCFVSGDNPCIQYIGPMPP